MRARFVERTACIFDFEIRNKQMFTEARAFSRVTYFFYFLASQLDFFLNLHSEISYPTPFSEQCKEMTQITGHFFLFGCQATLEIRETAASSYGRKQPVNTEETAVLYTLLWYVFITADLVYLNLFANSCIMPFHSFLYI